MGRPVVVFMIVAITAMSARRSGVALRSRTEDRVFNGCEGAAFGQTGSHGALQNADVWELTKLRQLANTPAQRKRRPRPPLS
jgi:hypothetical protein